MSAIKFSIGANITEFSMAMKDIKKQVGSMGSGWNHGLPGMLGLGVSVGGSIAYMKSLIDHLHEVGSQAEKMGIGTDLMQQMKYMASSTGIEVETIAKSFRKLKVNIAESNPALAQLGLNAAELKKGNMTDALLKTLTALKGVRNGFDQAKFASALLGKSGQDLIPLAEHLAELHKEAKDWGIATSPKAIQDATNFKKNSNITSALASKTVADSGIIRFGDNLMKGVNVGLYALNGMEKVAGYYTDKAVHKVFGSDDNSAHLDVLNSIDEKLDNLPAGTAKPRVTK